MDGGEASEARWRAREALRGALPLGLLLLLLAASWEDTARGGLDPVQHPDTASYRTASHASSLDDALVHYRTVGYPLLLRGVDGIADSWAPIPHLQLVAFLAGVLLFWHAVRVYTGSGWLALAAAAPLAFAPVRTLASTVLPDSLAVTLAGAALSLLLILARRPESAHLWAGLVLLVLASYQLRPAMIFLVVMVPPLGWLLWRLLPDRRAAHGRRLLVGLAAGTLAPWLLFSAVRWIAVGHFGVVSFGGTNLAGLAVCFLDDEVTRELPVEHRDLATRLLERRLRKGFQPITEPSQVRECLNQYNENLWRIALIGADLQVRGERRRARQSGVSEGVDWRARRIVRDERLGDLARAVLVRRPLLYLRWIEEAWLYSFGQLWAYRVIRWPAVLLAFSLPLAVVARRRRAGLPASPGPASVGSGLLGLALAGLGFYLVYTLLISLVSFPFERYFLGTVILLPSLLCAALFIVWRSIALCFRPA